MTARVVLSCDGKRRSPRCQRFTAAMLTTPAGAREVAGRDGWTVTAEGDLCPACALTPAAVPA